MKPHIFNIILMVISLMCLIPLIVLVDRSMYYGVYYCAGVSSYILRQTIVQFGWFKKYIDMLYNRNAKSVVAQSAMYIIATYFWLVLGRLSNDKFYVSWASCLVLALIIIFDFVPIPRFQLI